MIETVIFDLAEVCMQGLVGIEEQIAEIAGISESEVYKHLIGEKIYALFKGKLSEEEYWNQVIKEGSYNLSVDFFKSAVRNNFKEIPGTKNVIKALKRKGFKIGLLSDHAREWISYIEPRFSFLNWFDEKCFSFESGHTKRSAKSFEYALQRVDSNPKTTLFIDDWSRNLKVARSAGIGYVYQFVNAEKLRKALPEFGIEL